MISCEPTPENIARILAEGPLDDLRRLPIVLSLDPLEGVDAEGICLGLSSHEDTYVRGNALLAFGHLARTLRQLDKARVKPVIEAGLQDPEPFVRGQADCAKDDTAFFLGWDFKD